MPTFSSPVSRRLIGFLFLLLALAGCRSAIGHTSTGGVYRVESLRGRLDLAGDLSSDSRTQLQWQAERELSEKGGTNVYYVTGPAAAAAAAAAPRSAKDVVPSDADLRSFDPISARATLNEVDVRHCKVTSANAYGHAKIVLNPDGSISKVIVDSPEGLSDEAVKCIGERFGATKLAPFKGSMVTMGATFALR